MNKVSKVKLIIVDLSVLKTSPAGSCVLSELMALKEFYEIHLFSTEVDENLKEEIFFHEIRTPSSPLLFRYLFFSFKVKGEIKNLISQLNSPYIIQTTQGQYFNSKIAYPHFCHRAYLNKNWKDSKVKGIRRFMRKLNHLFHSYMEKQAFNNAKVIVVPSQGLSRELIDTYPNCENKIHIIANPVDIEYFKKPLYFDINENRNVIGIEKGKVIISFVALGDFERKGLPQLMESLTLKGLENSSFLILVIGGKPQEIEEYKKQAVLLNIENKIKFVGFHADIRKYLWVSDLFALPSSYEIFPLVALQAAAAGLPLLVTKVYGVEEYISDGTNGWIIDRNALSINQVLKGIQDNRYNLNEMGLNALVSVENYEHKIFRKRWLNIYNELIENKNFS